MKKIVIALSLAMVFALIAGPVMAANPHFVWYDASVNKSSGQLVVSWKEAGLGDNALVAYTASADSTAVWGCINGGNHHPRAANKETVTGPLSDTKSFYSGKNGQITGAMTLGPIPATPDFSCPPGQHLRLIAVNYTNITLTDDTNGITVALPDASWTLFP